MYLSGGKKPKVGSEYQEKNIDYIGDPFKKELTEFKQQHGLGAAAGQKKIYGRRAYKEGELQEIKLTKQMGKCGSVSTAQRCLQGGVSATTKCAVRVKPKTQ